MMPKSFLVRHIIDVSDNVAILTVLCAGFKPKFEKTVVTRDEHHHSIQLNLPMYLENTAARQDEPVPDWPGIDIFGGNVIHQGAD
jgi:hypothetical protein